MKLESKLDVTNSTVFFPLKNKEELEVALLR